MLEINVNVIGLEGLADALLVLADAINFTRMATPTAQDVVEVATNKKAKEKPEPEKKKEPAPKAKAEKTYTADEVRALFLEKNSAENRPGLKEILSRYGANNISTLEEEHFTAVVKDLEEI